MLDPRRFVPLNLPWRFGVEMPLLDTAGGVEASAVPCQPGDALQVHQERGVRIQGLRDRRVRRVSPPPAQPHSVLDGGPRIGALSLGSRDEERAHRLLAPWGSLWLGSSV
jgi:hypothetical protein